MRSRKIFVSLFALSFLLFGNATGCKGKETSAELKNEQTNHKMNNFEPDSTLVDYLKTNKIANHHTTADGITYTVEVEGKGALPKVGDYVKVHYTGTLLNGEKFDSSKDRNQPFIFQIGQGQVIPGWDKGIPLFNVGGKGKLFLPSKLAYGSRAAGSIPANSPLIFDIEVLEIVDEAQYAKEQNDMISGLIANYVNQNFKDQVAKDQVLLKKYAEEKDLKYETTASGLMIVTEVKGDGPTPIGGKSMVTVNYRGTTLNGKQFDSSFDRKEPFEFALGRQQVIIGWDEGIMHFNVGGKGKLLIPSSMAYGDKGAGADIPANAPLVFDIEVVGVK